MDGDDFNDLVAVYSDEPAQAEAVLPVVPPAPLDEDDDAPVAVESPVRRLKKPAESDDDDNDNDNGDAAERPAAAPAEDDDDENYVRFCICRWSAH